MSKETKQPKEEKKAEKEAQKVSEKEAKREAKEAKQRERAEKEAQKVSEKEAKREAKEAKQRERAEKEAQSETIMAIDRAEREAGKAEEEALAEFYQGSVRLTIVPPIYFNQWKKLEKNLRQVQNLRLVSVGGSADEGTWIIVSAEKPIPLFRVLRELPTVEQVAKKGKEIQVKLRVNQSDKD